MLYAKELKEIWLKSANENPEIMARINDGIEQNRKGDFKIRFIDQEGNPLKNVAVKLNQKSHEFKFGAHIFMLDEFEKDEDNAKFRKMFKEHFNLATLPFYWNGIEPEKGKPRYSIDSEKLYRRPATDLCMQYCEENGIDTKLHCLVYDKFTPEWLPKDNMAEMELLYEKRFKEISERYAGRMVGFEVINETLDTYLWTNHSVIISKKDLNEWAFTLARKYFPNDTLIINEAGHAAQIGEKGIWSAYYLEIENALLKGLPIDKIGIQYHIFTGATAKTDEEYEQDVKVNYLHLIDPKTIFKMLDTLGNFGLPIEMTEVTIPTFGEGEEFEDLQAELLKLLYSIWFSHPNVDTIVYWNQIDGYCHMDDNWNENKCRGGFFHHDLTPKKSALMYKKLITEVWHTEDTVTTDENGYIEFKGFFGDYEFDVNQENINAFFGKNSERDIVIKITKK